MFNQKVNIYKIKFILINDYRQSLDITVRTYFVSLGYAGSI